MWFWVNIYNCIYIDIYNDRKEKSKMNGVILGVHYPINMQNESVVIGATSFQGWRGWMTDYMYRIDESKHRHYEWVYETKRVTVWKHL